MAIIKTANSHQTSLLVSQHIPEFVRSDHPKFVTFIEKYYEFLANNSLMQTSDGTNYYGVDYASKALTDIHDIDTTDLDKFIGSFQKQYAINFPVSIYNIEDSRILYKNILDFYRALGTEDSFKMLFRLIYNEEIEIYYPKQDMLIASGGNYSQRVRIKVRHVDNLNKIENLKIVGSTSGAYGTIETVNVLPPRNITFMPGDISKTSSSRPASGQANTDVYDSQLLMEKTGQEAFVNLTDQHGKFELFEEVYYVENNIANTTVANTTVLPLTRRILLYDNFDYGFTNSVVSFTDGLHYKSSSSTYTPWGSSNIAYANTGQWHTHGSGQGEIKIIANTSGGTLSRNRPALQIGNNCGGTGGGTASASGDLRHFVYSQSVPVRGENTLYKLSIRARDLGGNSAASIAEGNRFSAGVACIRHDLDKIDSNYTDTYDNPLWFTSHQQAIDNEFFIYTSYFKGRQQSHSPNDVYPSKNYGSGGRNDLTSGTRYYNSIHKAINGEVVLPFNTSWIKPTFKVNEPVGASYSQGITEIDFIQLEEIDSMQSNIEKGSGDYLDESSLLSTKGAHLSDGYYRQIYAYDIRSQQQMKDYNAVVRKTAHPAGLKMFGTKVTETYENVPVSLTATNLSETFSPYSINALAGWWRADAIGPQNVEWRRWSPDSTSNGIFGTNTNRMVAGLSSFEGEDDGQYIWADASSSRVVEGMVLDYSDISAPPIGGKRSLKITDEHMGATPRFFLTYNKTGSVFASSIYGKDVFTDDHNFGIVLEPHKTWLLSCYAMTSNTVVDSTPPSSLRLGLYAANATGSASQQSYAGASGAWAETFTAENTWQRLSNTVNLTSLPHTRFHAAIQFPDQSKFVEATGNTVYHIDGFMIEEYIPEIHGTQAPFTPSPFVRPGMGGANVVSWHDQSLNEHHVYANTHGGLFHAPQFIANAVNGMPAVRFSANTVKNTANVYTYSSLGGTVNALALEVGDSTAFMSPTSGLQSTKSLASSTLSRPVSNTWTIMAVVKTNLAINSTSYDTTLNPTVFNSGYGGNKNSLDSGAGSITGTMHLGYDVIDETGAVLTNVVNSTAGIISTNTAAIADFGDTLSSANTETFRIVGMSINASSLSGSSVTDLLNFHIDGRRFANSEINNTLSDMSYTGMHGISQNNYVTSIGKWAPGNATATISQEVKSVYPYGAADWDGDIAEILVFNEKLTNTNIAFVEGYLAHKYSLQENLLHKDGSSAANTYAYKWDFTNTEDGWAETNNGTLTKHAANLQFTGRSSSGAPGHSIYTDFPSEPIDGGGFQSIKIRFWRSNVPDTETWSGRIRWTTTRSGEGSFETGTSGLKRSVQFDGSVPADITNFYDHYIVPATLTAVTNNWANSMITGLKLEFSTGVDSETNYYIDEISVYDATRTHHPFRYDAPSSVRGFANSWYRDY